MRGNPNPTSRALQEEATGTGATRNLAETGNAEGMRSSGQLGRTIAGTAEGPKPRGNLRIRTPAQQKGSGVRGNPEPQPGRSGKMQEAGQLATSSTGRTGRCMIQWAIRSSGKRQGPKGLWRFRWWLCSWLEQQLRPGRKRK